MPNTFTQSVIAHFKCGELLWLFRRTSVDVSSGIETEVLREEVCAKCDKRRYFEMLKAADKVLPVTEDLRKL